MSPGKNCKASESVDSEAETPHLDIKELYGTHIDAFTIVLSRLTWDTQVADLGSAPINNTPISTHIDLSKIDFDWAIVYPTVHDEGESVDDDISVPSASEWPWSTTIWGIARNEERVEVGQMYGTLIQRSLIRRYFSEDLSLTSQDGTSLALEVFDRYGRLKDDLKNHRHKRGSGVWGDEVDHGDFLIVEEVSVSKECRRHGLGSKLANELWRKTKSLNPEVRFAFASQIELNTQEVEERRQGMTESEIKADVDSCARISINFLRRQGYRRIGHTQWLALATDAGHLSHNLAAGDDRDWIEDEEEFPEDAEDSAKQRQLDKELEGELDLSDRMGKLRKLEGSEELLLHYALTILDDEHSAEALHNSSATVPLSDAQWEKTDSRGNTILHLAASHSNPTSVAWIMDSGTGARLLEKLNLSGETALEALESRLEFRRVKYQAFRGAKVKWVSDKFRYFDHESVQCLLRLQGLQDSAKEIKAQVACGCTCGECIWGIISPRMRLSLLYQAELLHKKLNEAKEDRRYTTEDRARSLLKSYGKHIDQDIHLSILLNSTVRSGYINMFKHIATCLRDYEIPNEEAVLKAIAQTWEAPRVTRSFLDRGGNVASAMDPIFEAAMDHDAVIGDGNQHPVELYLNNIRFSLDDLATCRNDHEYGFGRAYCAGGPIRGWPPEDCSALY